jgi:hypothetical protein
MNELETQVAKIQIGDLKQSTTYVYVVAEKVDATESELYVLCELPLFNPAAADDCERICSAIAAGLRRSYRKTANDNTFENALAQINDELGKLASMGKTHWVGKLNALIAVKRGTYLSIATVGKITALLYRDNNFASVTEPSTAGTPLKTFENFSVGKLKLDDLLIFSTTQLFNHIAVDRIKQILEDNPLPEAAGQMIDILRDNAGPEVACATILALQVEPGLGRDEEIDLSPYTTAPVVASQSPGLLDRVKSAPQSAVPLMQGALDQVRGLIQKRPTPNVKGILNKNKAAAGLVHQQFKKATQNINPDTFRGLSGQKKFFLISAAILFVMLIVSITVTARYRTNRGNTEAAQVQIADLQKLANDADAALIYNDEAKARELLSQLQARMPSSDNNPLAAELEPVRRQISELEQKLNKQSEANVTQLATLSNAENLITLPTYFATEARRNIVSYNRTNGSVQDNALRTSEPIVYSSFISGDQAIIHNGRELFVWNFRNGTVGSGFTENVPASENLVGFEVYPVNSRVYMIDKAGSRVVSFAIANRAISRPVIAIQNVGDLSQASDLTIDGSIYIAVGGRIDKYLSGAKQEFNPALPGSLSSTAKLYTQTGFQNLYVLDSDNERIIILNKQGGLVATLVSAQFSNMKDFTVDERAKRIYVLNDGALLQVSF